MFASSLLWSRARFACRRAAGAALCLHCCASSACAQSANTQPATTTAWIAVAAAGGLSVAGVAVALAFGRRLTEAIGVDGMTRIALLAVLHFTVSFSAKIVNTVLTAVAGPYALFVSGIGGEILPSFVQAVTVAVVRRPGALALSNLTVALLNGICAGQLGPLDVWLAIVGAALGELCLFAVGATQWPAPRAVASRSWPYRCALGLAIYNGGTWFLQYSVYEVAYGLYFPVSYVAAVTLIVGIAYGGAGAMVGALWGVRLREVS